MYNGVSKMKPGMTGIYSILASWVKLKKKNIYQTTMFYEQYVLLLYNKHNNGLHKFNNNNFIWTIWSKCRFSLRHTITNSSIYRNKFILYPIDIFIINNSYGI